MNTTVVILVITVTMETGNMKKNIIVWTIILVVPWFIICIIQLFVRNESSWVQTFLFPSLTALYTGFSVVVSYRNLIEEKNNLIKQTKISVFSEAINLLANDTKYQESLKYVLSGACDRDNNKVRKILNVNKNKSIGLDDYWAILYQKLSAEGVIVSEEEKKELNISYEKIKYFCQKMEYLGILSEDKEAGTLIIKLYKDTIINTYDTVKTLIEKDGDASRSKCLYIYYNKLYELAKGSGE